MEDYTKLLAELYSEFDPERVKQIGYFLEKYKGKEKQFYISQKAKYKDKKPISDSKKIIEEALARIKSQGETKPNMTEETDKEPKSSAGDPRNIKPIPKQASEEIKKELSENKRVSYSFGGEPKLGDKNKAEPSAASTEDKPKTWFGDDNNTSSNDSASEVNKLREENARKMRSFQEEDESSNSKSDNNWGSSACSKPNVKSEQSEKEDYALPKSKDFHPLDNDIKFNQKYFLYIFMMVILVISVAVFIFFIFIKQSGTKDLESY